MTVQCAILNTQCEIFASDERITTPDNKTYDGVQKIFKITNSHPSKIMINGNMEFENIPMNTIINEFKKKTNFKELKTIEDIKNEFIKFIECYAPTSNRNEYMKYVLTNFKNNLLKDIHEKGFEKVIENKKRKEIYPFIEQYSNFNDEFEDIIPKNENKEKYSKILWEIFCYELRYEGTGAIIAGYNIDSPYPSFFEINLHCNDENGIIYEELESKTDFEDTIIRIYAMNEEGYAFFTGINDEFHDFLRKHIDETNNGILQKLKWIFEKENMTSIDKILRITEKVLNEEYSTLNNNITYFKSIALEDTSESIQYIPCHLLCTLADEIIRLTAIKQKISLEEEYVSITSHISLITKSNGFKWIKFNHEIL